MRSRQIRFWCGLALTVIAALYLAKNTDLSEVLRALTAANYLLLLPAAVLRVAMIWGKVLRWRLLFSPVQGLRQGKLLSALLVSQMVNTLLPGRLGEIVRAYLISREGVKKGLAFSTILVEKVLDVLILLLFLASLAPRMDLPPWVRRSGEIFALIFVLVLVSLVGAARWRRGIATWVEKVLKRAPWLDAARVMQQVESVLDGFSILGRGRDSLRVLAWSLAIWVLTAVYVYIVMMAFRIPAPFIAAVLQVCVTALGMTVPSSPGYIGVYHYLSVLALSLFAVDRDLALSFALVLHFLSFAPLTMLGLVFVWKENLSLRQVQTKAPEKPL